ncbi:MAG: hypothetical protein WCG47_18700 [Dermatophilaceae bacterium]
MTPQAARLGIGAAIRRVAARRKIDGQLAERVIFALVAQRALEPGFSSALAGSELSALVVRLFL